MVFHYPKHFSWSPSCIPSFSVSVSVSISLSQFILKLFVMVVKYTYHQIYHLNHLNVPFSSVKYVHSSGGPTYRTLFTLHGGNSAPSNRVSISAPCPLCLPQPPATPVCLVSMNSTAAVKHSLCPWVTGVFQSA